MILMFLVTQYGNAGAICPRGITGLEGSWHMGG